MQWKHSSGKIGKIFGSSGEVRSKDAAQKRRQRNRQKRRTSQNMKQRSGDLVGATEAAAHGKEKVEKNVESIYYLKAEKKY